MIMTVSATQEIWMFVSIMLWPPYDWKRASVACQLGCWVHLVAVCKAACWDVTLCNSVGGQPMFQRNLLLLSSRQKMQTVA